MNSIMPNQQPFLRKQNFPLRLYAAAFVISLLTTVFGGWQMWEMHHRVEALSDKRAALVEDIGSIMLYDEVLTMSARMAAATGDFSYEKRYDEFDSQLTREIGELRAILPQAGIAEFVRETDDANNALVEIERQAFALAHQGKRQAATALLISAEYKRLKNIYADGMQKAVNAANELIESEGQYLDSKSLWSVVASAVSVLVLLAAWFFSVRSARSWAAERREAEGALVKVQDRLLRHREQLEQEVAQRTVSLTEAQRIAHLGNWELDVVNSRLDWSDEIYRIFGLTPQQFDASYEAFLQAVHPEDRQLVEDCVREALEQGHPYSIDHRIQLPDGTVRYVHEQAEVFRNDKGEPLRMQGTVQDITERKLAAQALEESELKFRTILDSAVDGILVADGQSHKFVTVNDAICVMLGYQKEEMYKLGVEDVHPEEALSEVQEGFERQLKGEMRMALNLPVKRKDGSVFFADISASPMLLAGRNFLVGVFHDVTERKQAEDKQQLSALKYQLLFDSSRDALMTMAPPSWKFTGANQATLQLFGVSSVAEFTALGPWDVSPSLQPDGRPSSEKAPEMIATAMREGSHSFEWEHQRLDGRLFAADVLLTRMDVGEEVFVQATVRDITERKLVEEKIFKLNAGLEAKVQERTQQLLDAQEELVRKGKLAVLGQVAGSVGHELRNPLGVMSNAVYFLQTVLTDADETTREYLDIIKNEIASSDRIVSDLLDSVRTKPPQPEIVDMRGLLEKTLGKCVVPPAVTVKLEIPATVSKLLVDPQQIHQVFRNLISNGIEAISECGVLEIRAFENKPDATITVSVCDNGIGMTAEQMGKLFQPLFTTKSSGIGLGLVVVKNLTEANGGAVAVQSEVGLGTTFTVTLPAAPSSGGEA